MNDLDHLRNLLGRYTERIDAGDFAGVGALFERGGLAGGEGPPFVVVRLDIDAPAGPASAVLDDGTVEPPEDLALAEGSGHFARAV